MRSLNDGAYAMTDTGIGETFVELGQHYQMALSDARDANAKASRNPQDTPEARVAAQLKSEIENALRESATDYATLDTVLPVFDFDGMHNSGTSDDDAKAALRAALRPPPFDPDADPIACASWKPTGGWPEREWLIPDWLPVGRLGMLSGRGGRGKSRLALQLSAHLAGKKSGPVLRGNPAALHIDPKHRGPVVYASWEDERDEVGRRLSAMEADKLIDVEPLENQLLYLDLRGAGPLWAPGTEKHVQTQAALTTVGVRVRATAELLQARLLVLDSLAGAYASDENVRSLVRAFCADWDAWATEHQCAVLLIAHPPKRPAGQRNTDVTDTDDDFSGSTDWHNAVRWRWTLRQIATEMTDSNNNAVHALALSCVKSSYGPTPERPVFLAGSDHRIGWQAQTAACAAEEANRRDNRNAKDTQKERNDGKKNERTPPGKVRSTGVL